MPPRYLVKNSNGAILGGFLTREEAERCALLWEARYERSPLVNGIKITIKEQEVDKLHQNTVG